VTEPIRLADLYRAHVASLEAGYARAFAASSLDAVVIHSGSQKKRSLYDDQYFALRVTPHFQHWLPLAEPDCALVVGGGKRAKLVRLRATNIWEKLPPVESDEYRNVLEIVEVDSVEQAKEHFPRGANVAFLGEDRQRADSWGFSQEHIDPPALLEALDSLRTTKTDYEIACLDEANRRAALGHEAVLVSFLSGDPSELDLHLRYLAATMQDDPETPYKNIIARGANAATLHHIAYEKEARGREAESLLVDAGACFLGYGSDVTRTWVRGAAGEGAKAYAALVARVEAMQTRLCAAIKTGMPYEALHDESHRQVAVILRELGIAKGSMEALVDGGVTRAFYPHGLGHSLGLQTHDVGCAATKPRADNPFLRNTSIIAARQTFTIEPGIYFIDGLLAPLRAKANDAQIDWTLVDTLAQLGGVRIEDDVVVLDDGEVRNLTREHLPAGGGVV
jgi:Xaa-Pro dipeptidase